MPLLIERPPEGRGVDEICPICNRPKKLHTITEIQICSKKLKEIEGSGR